MGRENQMRTICDALFVVCVSFAIEGTLHAMAHISARSLSAATRVRDCDASRDISIENERRVRWEYLD